MPDLGCTGANVWLKGPLGNRTLDAVGTFGSKLPYASAFTMTSNHLSPCGILVPSTASA